MSADHQPWVTRMRYVILDEIHCIGEGDEEGRAWERLVQLIPCPFLALSATVGNPESFHHWLGNAHVSNATTRHDGKPAVDLIRFGERYADLSTCLFSADIAVDRTAVANQLGIVGESPLSDCELTTTSFSTEGKSERKIQVAGGLYSLNPFICLAYKQIFLEGISGDFYSTSGDLLKVSNTSYEKEPYSHMAE